MHGGLGVGKSEVLKLVKELFTNVLCWIPGLDFQLAALQAVMAEQLGGDALHHACGIATGLSRANERASSTVSKRQTTVANQILQLGIWINIEVCHI